MTATRSLQEIGSFPIVGDAIEVRDRWAPHPVFATATITGTDATHVTVESRLTTMADEPVRYRIPRSIWALKCAPPNTIAGGVTT